MLDREQDKAINEARRRLTEAPDANALRGRSHGVIDNIIPDEERNYVAGKVAEHERELHAMLTGKDPDKDYDVIRGQILIWAKTKEFEHRPKVLTQLVGRILQLLTQDAAAYADQPNPYPHSSWRTG